MVKIKKLKDMFLIRFYTQKQLDGYDREYLCSFSTSIRFRNSGSRYDPFNLVFMQMFQKLQEVDDVLDENHQFYGIFTHDALMDLLSQSWSVRSGGVAIAVATHNEQGDLSKISKIITRYSNVESLLTIRSEGEPLTVLFTLPLQAESEQLAKLIKDLEKKQYTVDSVENLNRFK